MRVLMRVPMKVRVGMLLKGPVRLPTRVSINARIRPWGRWLAPAVIASLLSACAALPAPGEPALDENQYRPGPMVLDPLPANPFGNYQARVKRVLEANLVAVPGFPRVQQIQWNLPFRLPARNCSLKPAAPSTGILLVHGLSDSPFVFRDLGAYLSAHCMEVRTLLLQGHGTRPGDLVGADADVWRAQVASQFRALARSVDRAFIGGFSLGGGLATEYALSGQAPVPAGLVSFAPAWELNGLSKVLWLAPVAGLFSDFVAREPERNPVKYESVPFNAGAQTADVLSGAQAAIEGQERIDLPLFLVASEADSVINLGYLTRQFRSRFVAPANRMLVFRDLREPWPEGDGDARIRSFNSYLPELNIREFSHQSLAIAPSNPLYGPGAPLQRCLEPNGLSVADCQALPDGALWYGAWHEGALEVPTSRLTWNPWFPDMAKALVGFLGAGYTATHESH